MGQAEAVEVLENNKGVWMTTNEIAKKCDCSPRNIASALRKIYAREARFYKMLRRINPMQYGYQWMIEE